MMRIFVFAALVVLSISRVSATEISWVYVQHRIYETGRSLNRLAFGLIDEKGRLPTDGRNFTKIQLFAPDGTEVSLLKYRFDADEEIFGIYDAVKCRWYYSDNWQFDSWFRANFIEQLIPGRYRLEMITDQLFQVKTW